MRYAEKVRRTPPWLFAPPWTEPPGREPDERDEPPLCCERGIPCSDHQCPLREAS